MKTLEDVWTSCLQTIETLVNNAQSFDTWFKPIKPVKLDNNVLTLLVPSKFFYDWIEEHHADKLSRAVKEVLGKNAIFEYQIPAEKDTERNGKPIVNGSSIKGSLTAPKTANLNGFGNPHVIPGVVPQFYESGLRPGYTFANFIEGDCNLLAKSAGIAIAKNPGSTYNPMVVHGGVGLGKTHLAHAIGNEILKLHPEKKVVVVTAETYLNQFIDAVKSGSAHTFSNYYNSAEVLIIDDIHIFSNKDKTQENLFHVFNVLHHKGKQLIFTSDVAPSNLQGMDDRLLSRFKWGLTVELQAPDYETRIAILERKSQEKGFVLKREFAEYIAHNIKENIRVLEGSLTYISANVNNLNRTLDIALVKEAVKAVSNHQAPELTCEYITNATSEHYRISVDHIKGKSRKRELVNARQVAMYLCRKFTSSSLSDIGRFFNRDHSTVIHACTSVDDQMGLDVSFKAAVDDLIKKIKMSG